MLCTACQKVFDSSPKRPHPKFNALYYHHDFAGMIEDAANAGCQVCSIIWDRFSPEEKLQTSNRELRGKEFSNVLVSAGRHARGILGKVLWKTISQHIWQPAAKQFHQAEDFDHYGWQADLDKGIVMFTFGTYVWKSMGLSLSPCKEVLSEVQKFITDFHPEYKCADELIGTVPVEVSMDTPATWELINSWTSNCSADSPDHVKCHKNTGIATDQSPTRLIDITAKTESGLRLSLSAEERLPLPYVTLSYAWGSVDPNTLPLLRKSSISSYAREIPEQCLPVLFREAVKVARNLGYSYLWIDAFCIIQDDEADFQQEAALMGEIYSKAILNIAAGGASNSNDRLLRERNPRLVNPCRVEVDWTNLGAAHGRKADQLCLVGSFYIVEGRYAEGQMLTTPLNRRAWVLQEQELSPRILHFGQHQVFWHCWGELGSALACEAFPKGTPIALSFKRPHQKGIFTALSKEDLATHQVGLYLSWNALVQTYSRCGITHKTDKLLALSGIAQKFSQMLNHETYAAGIWRSQLMTMLCWQVDLSPIDGSPKSERYERNVAPSWSWASVSGYVKLIDEYFLQDVQKLGVTPSELAEMIDVDTKPLDRRNRFGQLESARITLFASIVPDTALRWYYQLYEQPEYGQRSNVKMCGTTGQYTTFLLGNFDDIGELAGHEKRRDRSIIRYTLTGVHLLPLVDWKHPTDRNNGFIEGIIIVDAGVGNNYTFRRIGYFRSVDGLFKNVGNRVNSLYAHTQEGRGIILI